MSAILTGMNTGVIRHGEQFLALALKINQHNEQQLLLLPALALRDLLICFEYRLHLQHLGSSKQKARFKQQQDAATAALQKNIPDLTQSELLHADVRQRVEKIEPLNKRKNELQLTLTLQGGNTLLLIIEDAQIALIINAITHAINNAGMHPLSLRLASLLDFLPLYDAQIKPGGELEYDTYQHPAWKLALFSETLALVYHYTDEQGEQQAYGTVVKTRNREDNKAVAQRLLAFSPRLKNLEGISCQVSVSTLASGADHLPRERCLRAIHALWQKTAK
ncbi:YjeJ family protein [Scandinavium lactucae]|uniref:YjeJ family protein n=1 Tax=Scandinavium lactucae TaxID=3095028 RepID=A0ABU4QMG9_9ENTR|nr:MULTISPECIES: YjeJ family protein [unclassified Scandinavium]MDX6040057.1 YjeJ family protein [Scandinavium sp. V105_6]MDX6049485.1 YjeJ family protein [Scandinavium sp. V105_1]